MDGNKRRQAIVDILKKSLQPVSGTYLAKTLQVSRQVIVQDIALLRAGDYDIYSTHKGYVLNTQKVCKRIFKVHHDDNEVEKEDLIQLLDVLIKTRIQQIKRNQ